jgi:hypothetical protein
MIWAQKNNAFAFTKASKNQNEIIITQKRKYPAPISH